VLVNIAEKSEQEAETNEKQPGARQKLPGGRHLKLTPIPRRVTQAISAYRDKCIRMGCRRKETMKKAVERDVQSCF
jgi:hypothetical protein